MTLPLLLGWTTCDNQQIAERLALDLVERKLAVCVQIESIQSVYSYNGSVHREPELRLSIKFLKSKANSIESYILANHTYETPEWVVVAPETVNQKYLEWAQDS